jgi:hypothetical protein
MAKPKAGTNNNQATVETHETTLAKRILNSNLIDEDKIDLIQLISNRLNTISIPFVWTPDIQPLTPTYRKQSEFIVTCSVKNNGCLHSRQSKI